MKKISLIIPVYNSEKYIDSLMESIIKQTFTDYEVIFVNDGSTDKSLDILNEYKQKYKNIKVVTIKNSGPGVARKIGFKHSNGKLLFFVDSDDQLYDSNVLEKISQIYDETNFELLCFNVLLKSGKGIKKRSFLEKTRVLVGANDISFLDKYVLNGILWCKVFVREKMKEEYFYNAFNFEDFYITYSYLNECNSFYYTDDVFYCYNSDNASSVSKKQTIEKMKGTVTILKKVYSKSKHRSAVAVAALEYYWWLKKCLLIDKRIRKNKRQIKKLISELEDVINLKLIFNQHLDIKTKIKIVCYILERKIFK